MATAVRINNANKTKNPRRLGNIFFIMLYLMGGPMVYSITKPAFCQFLLALREQAKNQG
jgi:hypothetical protein